VPNGSPAISQRPSARSQTPSLVQLWNSRSAAWAALILQFCTHWFTSSPSVIRMTLYDRQAARSSRFSTPDPAPAVLASLTSQSRTAFRAPPMGVVPEARSSLFGPVGKSSWPSIQVASCRRLDPLAGNGTTTSPASPKPPEVGSPARQQLDPL
jgi:hypothetical protein